MTPNTQIPGASREERLRRFLELCVWPNIPPEAGRPWTSDQGDDALGYGDHGEPS